MRHVLSSAGGEAIVVSAAGAASGADDVVGHDGAGFGAVLQEDTSAVGSHDDIVEDVHARVVGHAPIPPVREDGVADVVGLHERVMGMEGVPRDLVGALVDHIHPGDAGAKCEAGVRGDDGAVERHRRGATEALDPGVSHLELSPAGVKDVRAIGRAVRHLELDGPRDVRGRGAGGVVERQRRFARNQSAGDGGDRARFGLIGVAVAIELPVSNVQAFLGVGKDELSSDFEGGHGVDSVEFQDVRAGGSGRDGSHLLRDAVARHRQVALQRQHPEHDLLQVDGVVERAVDLDGHGVAGAVRADVQAPPLFHDDRLRGERDVGARGDDLERALDDYLVVDRRVGAGVDHGLAGRDVDGRRGRGRAGHGQPLIVGCDVPHVAYDGSLSASGQSPNRKTPVARNRDSPAGSRSGPRRGYQLVCTKRWVASEMSSGTKCVGLPVGGMDRTS